MSRRRQLSDDDRALWHGVARSVTPLPRSTATAKPHAAADGTAPTRSRAGPGQGIVPPAKMPPLSPFERRLKQRVARGREPIDRHLDLHGLTQVEAHATLLRFLRRAQADGVRIALVVTGKGAGRSDRNGAATRGVLRRQVPLWLALPEFRPLVVGFEDAHAHHGGEGALYVRLRRVR